MMKVVFTGPGFDDKGRSIVRADLIAAAHEKHIAVQKRVDADTHVLVASRSDTVKAKHAAARGIGVMTYPDFIRTFLGEVEPTGAKPNAFTDAVQQAPSKEEIKAGIAPGDEL